MALRRLCRRPLVILAVIIVVVAVAVALGLWRPWERPVLRVTISLATDESGSIALYENRSALGLAPVDQVHTLDDIDLERWAGRLVRLDIEGVLQASEKSTEAAGALACTAEIITPAGALPLLFAGWENGGSLSFHPADLGSPAYIAPGGGDALFVYGKEGRLWCVFHVPEEAALRVSVMGLPQGDLPESPSLFVPPTEWRLPERSANARQGARPPDVFIYLIDALRADHLGCYGYARPTSPHIDAFGRRATLFENAYATATWTRPSVSSIVTGLFPTAHEVMHAEVNATQARSPSYRRAVLGEWPLLLSEAMQQGGYKTAFINTNVNVEPFWGFDQGVDLFVSEQLQTPDWINAQAEKFLAQYPPDQPVYLYLHNLEPHAPYRPEPATYKLFDRGFEGACDGSVEALTAAKHIYPDLEAEDIEYLIDLYDAEIRDNDTGFAQFLDLLKRTGRFENSLIIVVADHGEAFTEHDTLQHGRSLNVEEMHVPLIIRFPQGKWGPRRIKERASLVDIYPTVIGAAGLRPQIGYALPGVDLAQVAAADTGTATRPIFAEVSVYGDNRLDLAGYIDEEGFKRVVELSPSHRMAATEKSLGLWDTRADPAEKEDVTKAHPVLAAYHEQVLAHWLLAQRYNYADAKGEEAPGAAAELSEEMKEKLRALGYLE